MNGKVKFAISLLTIGSCAAVSPAAEALELMPLIRQIQEAGANRVGRETQRGVKRGLRVEDSGYNSSDYSDSNYYYGDEYEYSYEEMKNRSSSDEEWDSEETSDSEDSSENYYAPELPTSDSSKWETENQGNEFYDFEETKPASTSNWQKECDPEFLAEEEEECLPTYKGAEETAEPNWSGTHSDYPAPAPVANSSNGGGGVGAIITDTGDQLGQAAIVGVVGALVAWLQGGSDSDNDEYEDSWEDEYEDSWDEGYDNAYSNDVGEGYDDYWDSEEEGESEKNVLGSSEETTEQTDSWADYGEQSAESDPENWDGYEGTEQTDSWADYGEQSEELAPDSWADYEQTKEGTQYWTEEGEESNSDSLTTQETSRTHARSTSPSPININNINTNNNVISLAPEQTTEQTTGDFTQSENSSSYSRLKPSTANYLNQKESWFNFVDEQDDIAQTPPSLSLAKLGQQESLPLRCQRRSPCQKANQALSPKLPTAPVAASDNIQAQEKPLPISEESTDWAEIFFRRN